MGVALENVGELEDGEEIAQIKREEGKEGPSGNEKSNIK